MALDIEIKTIPHKDQRYPTVGDYWDKGEKQVFRVSDMGNWKYELLVAVHEMVEKALVKHRGIPLADIDRFDQNFEWEREHGMHYPDEEPGFDPYAPYVVEHTFATKIERMIAGELNVDWNKYADAVEKL